jgi:hypothetical protein
MSPKRVANAKHPPGEDGVAPLPASKRQKITPIEPQLNRSLLLEAQPEILRKIYAFLMLKEALVLRRAHRRFNNASNDLYQYSFITTELVMERQGFFNHYFINEYMDLQTQMLCNLPDNENLRALLRNETLPSSDLTRSFLHYLVHHSKTDNGQAVSMLLEDGRCKVDVYHFEVCLKKGFTAMAAVLQQDERVSKDIQMCHSCSNNFGCHMCTNFEECVIGEDQRYCSECIVQDDRLCRRCNDYLCQACFERGVYTSCEKCFGILCHDSECRLSVTFFIGCDRCGRKRCKSCMTEDDGVWFELEDGETLCCTCLRSNNSRGQGVH